MGADAAADNVMSMPEEESNFVKVLFHLDQDEDGYPPVGAESLWARIVTEGYQMDNIPFYVVGVSCEDVVAATKQKDSILEFTSVVSRSGHSTIRVCVNDTTAIEHLRDDLRKLGCESEQDYTPNLISVDIHPDVDIRLVWNMLEDGLKQELWEYEDACIQHTLD